jgi:hypothetical protein
MKQPLCRICGAVLPQPFLDLGVQPPCESYIDPLQFNEAESFYPMTVYLCEHCRLVQLDVYVSRESIFTEYAYFSSFSDSWLSHSRSYVEHVVGRFGLNSKTLVVEVASNDGYLLQYFAQFQVPVLGIEPAANVARAAEVKGVPTVVKFFGVDTAKEEVAAGRRASLLIGNNVLAQVPDLHDFVEGMRLLLEEDGVITLEFPHLLRLLAGHQFDTIYHEHFSYFSLAVVERLFAEHGLKVFDVEELHTHGGSLRVYACHESKDRSASLRLNELRQSEERSGLHRVETYTAFSENVKETKRKFLEFLIRAKREGKRIAGYGAPGKGNTLLNYCGVRTDFIDYVVDRNPYKQGKFLPGSRIPIYSPEMIQKTRPDYLLILPWNLKDEITRQMASIRDWGGRFVVPIPEVQVD